MPTIRIDDDVDAYIREHGKFGESYSDVLRRVLPGFKAPDQPVRGNDSRGRFDLFGHSACAVIRWMRDEGWTFDEVRRILDDYGLKVSDKTIECQLQPTRKGDIADLTTDQVRELEERR